MKKSLHRRFDKQDIAKFAAFSIAAIFADANDDADRETERAEIATLFNFAADLIEAQFDELQEEILKLPDSEKKYLMTNELEIIPFHLALAQQTAIPYGKQLRELITALVICPITSVPVERAFSITNHAVSAYHQ